MTQYLSQQFNSLLESWSTGNTQVEKQKKQFRAKILDLYDEIFIQRKRIKALEINFLHLKLHRKGLFQSIRKAMQSQSKNDEQIILLFNNVFQYCINSLLDEKLLVIRHAFQTMAVMLVSIAKCNRYLSVSDIVTYMCEFEQFDKYFEIIDERIQHTMLSLKDKNCKIAALEFTLSIMTISSNIHYNVFTEHLLIKQFHKILFKYLKYQIKEIHEQYQNTNKDNEEKRQHNNNNDNEEKKTQNQEKDYSKKEEEYTLQNLNDKQNLLMLILSNIIVITHYQRFESDNIALKYLSTMKVQPTKYINTIIVSLAQHIIKEYRELFPETRLHQIGTYVQSISGFFSSTIMGHSDNNDNNNNNNNNNNDNDNDNNQNQIIDNLLSNLTYCSSILLLSIYNNVTFNNPGWMVHSAGLRKSSPDEITKHPRVVVSPHEFPSVLKYLISLSSCIFQYYFYQKQVFEDGNNNNQKIEKLIESHEKLTRLSLIIYSRLTEIPACLIVLYSNDFVIDPFLEYAHKERNNIIWKQTKQQPIISILFEIWSDYIQNIGKIITQYQHNNINNINEETKEDKHDDDHELQGGLSSSQLFNPLYSSSTLFTLRILLDTFIRCMIFQNQMELFSGKTAFYLRLMKILMNIMKLFLVYNRNSYNEELFDILCRIVVTIRMMIGCCENIFKNKTHMVSFFLTLAKYYDYWEEFNEIIHNDNIKYNRQNDKFSERLKKDARVVKRVAEFFQDKIKLEFPDWNNTKNIQTPLHHSRYLELIRETLQCDEFQIPRPKLTGQYGNYQETTKKETKFFNDMIKKNIVTLFITKCLS